MPDALFKIIHKHRPVAVLKSVPLPETERRILSEIDPRHDAGQIDEILHRNGSSLEVQHACSRKMFGAGMAREAFRLRHVACTKILAAALKAGVSLPASEPGNEMFFEICSDLVGQFHESITGQSPLAKEGDMTSRLVVFVECLLRINPADEHGFRHAAVAALFRESAFEKAENLLHSWLQLLPKRARALQAEDALNCALARFNRPDNAANGALLLRSSLSIASLFAVVLQAPADQLAGLGESNGDLDRALAYRGKFGAFWRRPGMASWNLRAMTPLACQMTRVLPQHGGLPSGLLLAMEKIVVTPLESPVRLMRIRQAQAAVLQWKSTCPAIIRKIDFQPLLRRIATKTSPLPGCVEACDVYLAVKKFFLEHDALIKFPSDLISLQARLATITAEVEARLLRGK